MASARKKKRAARTLGIITASIAVVVFMMLMIARRDRPLFEERIVIKSDFQTITGLREGSEVQLSGVGIGYVDEIKFANVQYQCQPLTEDIDRFGEGRTDDCDDFLFCAPVGLCADLEPWVGKGWHPRCHTPDDCGEDEICVTPEFRRHAPKVPWSGPGGVCARFSTKHWRTRVEMNIEGDKLDLIRADSRAMIASNSVLGDQVVSITVGQGDPLDENRRIQARSSIYEDIERFRQRLDHITEELDVFLASMINFLRELSDERTMVALKGTLYNIEIITRDIAYGEGLIGALVSSPGYKRNVTDTMSALESTARGLEVTAARSNKIIDTVDRNAGPLLRDTQLTLNEIHTLLEDLEDPDNRSLVATLIRDPDGQLAEDLEAVLHNAASVTTSTRKVVQGVDHGKGTVGKLINDPIVGRDLGSLLSGLANRDVIQWLFKLYLQSKGFDLKEPRKPAAPGKD